MWTEVPPFRTKTIRLLEGDLFTFTVTYYDGGIRRSEALGLKGEDLKLTGGEPKLIVHRRPDDPDERFRSCPSVWGSARFRGALPRTVAAPVVPQEE